MNRSASPWAWLWVVLGLLYFFLPIYGTLDFSLRAKKDQVSFLAYENVLKDAKFLGTLKTKEDKEGKAFDIAITPGRLRFSVTLSGTIYEFTLGAFTFSAILGVATIFFSFLLIVPTAYWVHLKLRWLRPALEFITLMPFIIPVVVLTFGLIRTFSRPPLILTATPSTTDILLVAGYIVITFPYMYRAVDTGLRSIDVATLTEAAQSLGAGWFTILFRVVFPNLRGALISGALITFATVIGELILASFLARPTFGPYMAELGQNKAYEPAALAMISYALTWACLGIIQLFSRGRQEQIATIK
jgi:putative spermidine/putrescine transport system permease protein